MADWDQKLTEKEANASFFISGMKNLWFLLGTERSKFGIVILLTMVTESFAIGFPYVLKMIFDVFPQLKIDQTLLVAENYANNHDLLWYLFILFGVAFAIKVAQTKPFECAKPDARHSIRDFTRDEFFAPNRRLMIEQNTVAAK